MKTKEEWYKFNNKTMKTKEEQKRDIKPFVNYIAPCQTMI